MNKIPGSTYRLQFNKDFTFKSAAEILSYLKALGISAIYASPIWRARSGSVHGYDIVEPTELNPELGSRDDFLRFTGKVKENQLGWLQDIVPNHMAYSSDNQMLVDLLENGRNSRYFDFFDVDWDHPHASLHNKILAPFLGKRYRECLEAGEIRLNFDSAGFSISYYKNKLPLRIETYAEVLSIGLNELVSGLGRKNPDVIKYLGVVYFLRALPSAEELDERYYQIMFIKEILWELYSQNDQIRNSIERTAASINGKPGDPASFDQLNRLLGDQIFKLCYWKVAGEEINYRRFFNINELISLKMEDEKVFNRTHILIQKMVDEKIITGLRVDHVDGLYDPAAYLEKLVKMNSELFVVVEKILSSDEELPDNWMVEGTTGYDFLNYMNGLFINPVNSRALTSVYQRFIRKPVHSVDVAHEKKRLIIKTRMGGEVENLAYLIEAISSSDRYGIDITMHGLKSALEEILTLFPVYRTYISEDTCSEQDKKIVEYAVMNAKKNNPGFINEIDYIGNILLMNFREQDNGEQKKKTMDFIMRFQQLTGPIMAKGFEDTTFYVYNRFISANEVGCDPGILGCDREEFHNYILKRQARWPYSLNTASTHDTKRGEDSRARLNVLSEIPDEWEEKVKLWHKINRKHKKIVNQSLAPDRNDEYFLYQSIVGAFPFDEKEINAFRLRIKIFIVKAVREAKVHTAWIKPDEEYEAAFTGFVDSIFSSGSKFLEDFIPFIKLVSYYGVYNSVAQTIIRFLSPGVPDTYQGSELWNLSLVDPDNRKPVNYEIRKKILNEIITGINDRRTTSLTELIRDPDSGKIKLYIIYRLLQERNRLPHLYSDGEYVPLYAEGRLKGNVVGFVRKQKDDWTAVLVGRFFTMLLQPGLLYDGKCWNGTTVSLGRKGRVRDIITGDELLLSERNDLGRIFSTVPFAVLVNR